MGDGPGLHHSDAGGSGIGIDGDQIYLTGSGGSQLCFGIIHNLGRQWAQGFTARVNESQHNLATAQGRKHKRLTELVDKTEVRCEITCHWKAADGIVSRVRRLRGCLVARYCKKPDSPGSPCNYHEC